MLREKYSGVWLVINLETPEHHVLFRKTRAKQKVAKDTQQKIRILFKLSLVAGFRVEKRSAHFFCAYPFAGPSEVKTLPFDSVFVVKQWLLR